MSPTVLLTAAHCTDGVVGRMLVTFDSVIAEEPPSGFPVAADPSAGYTEDELSAAGYRSGSPHTHPEYSDFTDMDTWNDTGVVTLDARVSDIAPATIAGLGTLDTIRTSRLSKTLFTAVGYGTEVRKPESGPQKPTPMSYPLIRRYVDMPGQKLTPQILQTNGNPNDNRGTGGTCFGDSGGPVFLNGQIVAVTSYGYTSNCRYLGRLPAHGHRGVAGLARAVRSLTVEASASEPEVAPLWRDLGLPGLFDVHVHFLPPSVQAKVYAQFDQAGPKIGREWPIRYRGSHEARVELLRSFGVRHFSALPYAHRPGMATFLNDWAHGFADEVPECLWSATFYPEPEVTDYVAELIAGGVEIFKLHTQVGEFLLDDPRLDEAFGLIEDAGVPTVIHVGSGPVGNEFTGPEHLERLLRRHPRLTAVVAHMGAPEYAEFLTLAEAHGNVRLDTTMVFTDFFDVEAPYPDDLLARLADLGDRVLFGSDFPTIPYPYRAQVEGLTRLGDRHPGLGEEWLRRVLWHNAVGLFGRS